MGVRSRFCVVGSLLFVLGLSSCIGLSSSVDIRADGSGTISLEYRVSRLVESMGKTGGDDRWLPLPLRRAEMEQAVSLIDGLSLTSFSAKEDETDLAVQAGLSFRDLESFIRFWNSSGRSAVLTENGGKRSLSLRLAEGSGALDPDLKRLIDTVFSGYLVSLRFAFPSVPSVSGGGSVDAASRSASFSSSVPALLSTEKPLAWIITW